ncbi:MAG TPA: class I SAM-dependent methyltransferase [Candidatus Acidoferrum sp.]
MSRVRPFLARALRKATFLFEPPGPSVIESKDEYLVWLGFANAGMLNPGNPYSMEFAVSRLPSDAPILEIGSFCGLSTNLLTYLKRKHGRSNRLISCDKWDFEKPPGTDFLGNSKISHSEYRQFVRESYLRNIQMFSAEDLPYTLEMTSDEFFDAWKKQGAVQDVLGRTLTLGGPISFAYIDGNHTYEFAKRDFLNCDAFLEEDGFIFFDDSTAATFGVRDLMPEIISSGRYTLSATNPNHLFQKNGKS